MFLANNMNRQMHAFTNARLENISQRRKMNIVKGRERSVFCLVFRPDYN